MPANCNIIMLSMHNAITLEKVINSFYDAILPDFGEDDISEEDAAEEEELRNSDIPYKNVYMSLGIFGIFFGLLIFALLFYFLLRCLSLRVRICGTIL